MKEIARTRLGATLYVENTEQGRRYWSDEVGGGVMVWHTALVSTEMLRLALETEEAFDRMAADLKELDQ